MKIPLRSALILLALLFLPAASGASEGRVLYAEYCSGCHGAVGEGGRAPALKKEGLLRTVGLEYFIKTIRFGRIINGCPSFDGKITEGDIKNIASFIKGWQKGESLSAPSRGVAPEFTKRGEEIFTLCGGCHGLEGEGAFGPPLLDPGLLASISDAELRAVIMWGRPGTPMRGFKEGSGVFANLTDTEIDQVIAYIRYMERKLKPE